MKEKIDNSNSINNSNDKDEPLDRRKDEVSISSPKVSQNSVPDIDIHENIEDDSGAESGNEAGNEQNQLVKPTITETKSSEQVNPEREVTEKSEPSDHLPKKRNKLLEAKAMASKYKKSDEEEDDEEEEEDYEEEEEESEEESEEEPPPKHMSKSQGIASTKQKKKHIPVPEHEDEDDDDEEDDDEEDEEEVST